MAELTTKKDLLVQAKEAEAAEDLQRAAEIYQKILKEDNLEVEAYDRLMIVYRKLKDFKNELLLIDEAIKAYQNFYNSRVSKSKKVAEISNKLAKSFGLIDKKGNSTYDAELIGRWKKRRMGLETRLKPKKN